MNSVLSCFLPVLSDVPQESILRLLLFLIYINNLPFSVTSSWALLLVNDTKCLLGIKSPWNIQNLQTDLDTVGGWGKEWNMLFNEGKRVLVQFFSNFESTAPCQYSIYASTITNGDHTETLVWLCQTTFLGPDIAVILCPRPTKHLVWLDIPWRQLLFLLNASFICLSFVPVFLTALQSGDHNMPEILHLLREFRDELLYTFWMTTVTSDYVQVSPLLFTPESTIINVGRTVTGKLVREIIGPPDQNFRGKLVLGCRF